MYIVDMFHMHCLGSYGKYLLSSWIFIAEFLQTKFLTFKHQQMKFMRKVLKKLPSQHWWGRMVSASLNASIQKSLQDVFYMWIHLFSVNEYCNVRYNYMRYLLCLSATVFAYGQTSSGKTYTMHGITENAADDIFRYVNEVQLSFYINF